MANVFTPGDLVVSVYGDGDGSGTYADNQASPIVLEQINPATGKVDPITGTIGNGTLVNGELVLPQTASGPNSVISGEYGSSSEGSLQLSADGQSLTIAGYGVNAAAYNAAEKNGNPYGNPSLAQTTSVKGGSYTAVSRVVADIDENGTVDTSTALYGVYNTNNPRSVVTTNGTSFYLGGQGVKGDTTQGVFIAQDGASSATAINTSDDPRTVEISNGTLYVSQDSKQPSSGGTANISTFATALPTGTSAETPLPGISQTATLSNGDGNSVNGSTGTVHLSPENFFFANSTTLYVADSGDPKQGGPGDGGLQKWSFNGTAWVLDYTLSAGLNLVADTSASGTTGLIGLTGVVTGNTVQLYATNSTLTDTGQTSLYGISDALSATGLPSTEAFTALTTAAPDTNIRGVAFAPQAIAPTITGTHASSDAAEAPVTPFGTSASGGPVTIGDQNTNATDTLTIALSGGGGTLADGNGHTGGNGTLKQTASGPDGTYTLAGTAAQVTAELDALTFVPANGTPGAAVSTTFALTDASSAGPSTGPDLATVVTDTAAPPTTGTAAPPANDTVSFSPQASFKDGTFTLTGTASSTAGVKSVEISAVENDGARMHLGAATVNANGSFTFQDRIGANVQGLFQAVETDAAGGTATSADPLFSLQGGLGPDYGAASQTRYTASGEGYTAMTRFNPEGSEEADVQGAGQTFTSAYDDTFHDGAAPETTFVFEPGHSQDVVDLFRIGGTDHDTLSFQGSDFGKTPQGELGALLRNTYDSQGGLTIVDPTTQDTVTLTGLTKSQLVHNARDIAFR